MGKETAQIFSSTGSLGVTRRPDNRVYINQERFSYNPDDIVNLQRLAQVVERNPRQASRGIFRGAVSGGTFEAINENGLHDRLEVALPLSEFLGDEDDSWLIYWAHNHESRQQIVPTEIMIDETSSYREKGLSPIERIKNVKKRGYRFTDQIDDQYISHIQSLWGSTFGWERDEVEALQKRLSNERTISPEDRTVWFSAICDNGNIISLATAERLTIPGPEGNIDLVESTEWKTKADYANQGLMTVTLIMLNAQILHDLQNSGNGLPIIYAECNFQSRSDRAGHGAGFVIPNRSYSTQIIKQNVRVGDGLNIPQSDLRDFTYLYLPVKNIEEQYGKLQRDTILKGGII